MQKTQELLRQLRLEVWAYGLEHLPIDSEHFVTSVLPLTNRLQSSPPAASAVLYAATG